MRSRFVVPLVFACSVAACGGKVATDEVVTGTTTDGSSSSSGGSSSGTFAPAPPPPGLDTPPAPNPPPPSPDVAKICEAAPFLSGRTTAFSASELDTLLDGEIVACGGNGDMQKVLGLDVRPNVVGFSTRNGTVYPLQLLQDGTYHAALCLECPIASLRADSPASITFSGPLGERHYKVLFSGSMNTVFWHGEDGSEITFARRP